MDLIDAEPSQKAEWNNFVSENFSVVGAFFQTWEWGEFQRSLGNNIRRFIIKDRDAWLGTFLAVRHKLPFRLEYIYIPRGPVLAQSLWENADEAEKIFSLAAAALQKRYPAAIFARTEPAIERAPQFFSKKPFRMPRYYIQPRYNTVINIERSGEEILRGFSPPMRHNIRKAERKGVRVLLKPELNEKEWSSFKKMRGDTSRRAGRNIFPGEQYFRGLTAAFPSISAGKQGDNGPRSGIFVAYHDGEPSAINIVIFFAKTATFLFGAAFTHKLVVKISPYLHWISMTEAKKLGFEYYDLGGVDSERWKSLTYFKQQFGGQTLTYMGNADAVLRPVLYAAYNILRPLGR